MTQKVEMVWVDTQRDWGGLYLNGELKWQGHPSDFEPDRWFYWMSMLVGASVQEFSGRVEYLKDYEGRFLPATLDAVGVSP